MTLQCRHYQHASDYALVSNFLIAHYRKFCANSSEKG